MFLICRDEISSLKTNNYTDLLNWGSIMYKFSFVPINKIRNLCQILIFMVLYSTTIKISSICLTKHLPVVLSVFQITTFN